MPHCRPIHLASNRYFECDNHLHSLEEGIHWFVSELVSSWCYSASNITAEESLMVIRGLGIQTSTSSSMYWSSAATRFIPTTQIQDIVIHEAFKGFEVRFYLTIIVEGESTVVVVFPVIIFSTKSVIDCANNIQSESIAETHDSRRGLARCSAMSVRIQSRTASRIAEVCRYHEINSYFSTSIPASLNLASCSVVRNRETCQIRRYRRK
jgi:phosphatidylinositol glycan class H protein